MYLYSASVMIIADICISRKNDITVAFTFLSGVFLYCFDNVFNAHAQANYACTLVYDRSTANTVS